MKKTSVVSMLAVLAVLAAVLTSFLGIRASERNMSHIALPDEHKDNSGTSGMDILPDGDAPFAVEITTDNVIELIESLARPDEYSAEARVSLFWDGGEESTIYRMWVRGKVSRITYTDLDGVNNSIVSPERTYYWSQNSAKYYECATAAFSADSVAAIPTYEDISAGESVIIGCGAAEIDGIACLWVRTSENGSFCDWYVDLDSGLLKRMERTYDGTVTYRAEILGISLDSANDSVFSLPNGMLIAAG